MLLKAYQKGSEHSIPDLGNEYVETLFPVTFHRISATSTKFSVTGAARPATIGIVNQDELFEAASAQYADVLERLVRAYESDLEKRKDLLQEIRLALWRSFAKFEGRCALRTWVYRIAHNTAASYVIRQRRTNLRNLRTLEEADPRDIWKTQRTSGGPVSADDVRKQAQRLDASLGASCMQVFWRSQF